MATRSEDNAAHIGPAWAAPSAAAEPFVIQTQARRHYWRGIGSLSIKSFYGGQASYEVAGGRYLVDDHSYLVLNHGQPYTVEIDSPTPTASFCLFFSAGFAEDVHYSLTGSTDQLLTNPNLPTRQPLHFFERTYPHDALLSPSLFRLRAALPHRPAEPGWLEEQLHQVMQRLLQVHQQAYHEVETIAAARPATREELYRRMHQARDYITACYAEPLTLADMTGVACLSPNYFLRTFKQLFRQTPHQFLIEKRLEQAQRLLNATDSSITEICLMVGFESLGSFSSLFRRRFGLSPAAYRRQKR